MPQNKNTQSGNVFIIILVAVFLFGALMFTFSRSGSQSVSSMSKQEAKIAAQEILNYARLVENAVDRVRRNGCSESEISFENSTVAGYTNANAPGDNSCHVFEPEGGKIEYIAPQENWLDNSFNANSNYGAYIFAAAHAVEGVGTSASELVMTTNYLKKDVCIAVNNAINVSNPSGNPPIETNDPNGGLFTGTYFSPVANNIGNDGGHNLPGKTAFCRNKQGNILQFIKVLYIR